jgi:hypothetical protein
MPFRVCEIDEEVLNSMSELSIDPNDESIEGLNESDSISSGNYWLNEIKSQEDTGRQIISISVLLLGLSITVLTSNTDRILVFANIPSKNPFPALNNSSIMFSKILYYEYSVLGFVYLFMFFFSLLFIWIMAIDNANYALRLERMPSYDAGNLESIANIKHSYISGTMKIITWGAIGVITIFMIFNIQVLLPLTSPDKKSMYLFIAMIVGSFWLLSIRNIFLNWARTPYFIRRFLQGPRRKP